MGGWKLAEASECANEQGSFWPYHDGLFDHPSSYDSTSDFLWLAGRLDLNSDQFRECLETGRYRDEVNADYKAGRRKGVRGVPTFFINDVRLVGAQSFSTFREIIDRELGK